MVLGSMSLEFTWLMRKQKNEHKVMMLLSCFGFMFDGSALL